MKTEEDYFTSTVEGAAGYEKMRSKNDPEDYSGYDPRSDEYPDYVEDYDEDEEEQCHCSDPGCPCDGIKHGRL